ncbi:nucleotidyltransferase domain-containing protein [Nocardia arizonensis]|uniref:nucleotidyltransferase domain-containing protein n=1 Tax=Nocardia arizonensis TaxID=1141647 RepID=UPI0006D1B85A|nr:nucleotidyltransferase domain-containing protein [Nocardia arizonensis]
MSETSIAERTIGLARTVFGENLLAAWVGGSYARGTQKPTSDIDTVVILREAEAASEREFAETFRDLHRSAGLKFDHCGEVFDLDTLEGLLTFTEACVAAVPAIQRSACYLADCPLSIFRKGDVVFKMLEESKIHLVDPGKIVDLLTARALDYFRRWPMRRIQSHKGQLSLPEGSRAAATAALWQRRADTDDWVDTPVGVSLGRWFGPDLAVRASVFDQYPPVTSAAGVPHACSLPVAEGDLAVMLTAQCLTFPASAVLSGRVR